MPYVWPPQKQIDVFVGWEWKATLPKTNITPENRSRNAMKFFVLYAF